MLCAVCAAAGHRVQHEFAFLWKFHAKHHAIDTPSPFSTLFIHPVDATLQVGLCGPGRVRQESDVFVSCGRVSVVHQACWLSCNTACAAFCKRYTANSQP